MIDVDHRSRMQLRQLLLGRRYRSRYRFTSGNDVKLFCSGTELFGALIERIDTATRDVALETYIFCDDAVGQALSAALIRAAGRGVRVRVITDGIGTARLALFDTWRAAGVEHRIYNPHLFGSFGFSRTHRKLAVIDDLYAYCGGINVVDDLDQNGKPLPFPRWDFAVELSGPVVVDVREAVELQWRRIRLGHRPALQTVASSASPLFPAVPATAGVGPGAPRAAPAPTASSSSSSQYVARPSTDPAQAAGPHRMSQNRAARLIERLRARLRASVRDPRTARVPCVAFVARDNVVNRRAIEKAYLDAIGEARTEVLLANPYFMPGRRLRRALVEAASRGVSVKLLIGRKEFALLDRAVPFLYHALLSAGVQIAEYEKTMLHGKVAVVDSKWGTVGSSNLDALSLVLNNEANVLLVLHPEIAKLRACILAAFDDAVPIDRAHYDARPAWERALNWLAYSTYRAAMKLLTVGGYD
ncbi:phospholipase D-like domain-containing protein [Paraburkholderia caballeronis]|uniref:Cardiolipin synthase B n=1 Tax=Paraburkholderia caballeronis TaxID=416943 RepID=A0A1H7PYX6_9BURK|nr:phospholipase D-like domain-containing protein [Paraburkholderia caballeronis]PXW24391.1 cardiolipin synthase [Paraburkholderia caballeronis]PXX00173.1 cardiolipin synthase [Paraburkholderia caballeronis]RAJ97302.1 cardiolipin synthase [Paraburkholderia caballeronis]TDV09866.1 cardiolipin synthase [Paraburkholderia caballeronis]TDV14111.1 cardiolipin synthase [Paraburkholderia caballeronis]